MHPGIECLEQLVAEERRLVQRIQDGVGGRSAADLFATCQRLSRDYEAHAVDAEQLSDSERELLADRLEEAARLNAIAISLLERERTDLLEQARQTRDVRQRMASMRATDRDAGRSCDVRG